VKARRAAANQFATRPSIRTDIPDRATPSPSASFGWMRPAGIGRIEVRRMTASMSASYHMLSAPDAPPPSAMNRIAAKARKGWTATGATKRPTAAVKTTSDITRGLRSCT